MHISTIFRTGVSRFKAFIAIKLPMTIVAWHFPQSSPVQPAPAAATPNKLPVSQVVHAFPLFGVDVSTPAGWIQLDPDRPTIVTRWISPQSRLGDIRGMIMIECGKPKNSAHEVARTMAAGWGGKLLEQQETLDGEVAWQIHAESTKAGMQPVEGLVAMHDGRLYMIEGGVTRGQSCKGEIDFIRKSWKWTTIDSPTKHVEFREKPLLAFEGKVSINFPTISHVFDDDHPERSFSFAFHDPHEGRPAFNAIVQFAKRAEGDTFSAARDRLAAGTQAKFKLAEALTWKFIGDGARVAITQPVAYPPDDRPSWIIWSLVALDESRFVLINFTLYSNDPDERAKYAELAERIVVSISLTSP